MNEAVVRRLWLAGGWPSGALRAVDGTALQVVYPGRAGHGAGPDLLDAIVALPDATLLRGDVELHVCASDWRAHGHEGDPRYARVVLHVVWRDDLGEPVPLPGAPASGVVWSRGRGAAARQPGHDEAATARPGDREIARGLTLPVTVALAELAEPLLFERLSRPLVPDEPYHDWLRRLNQEERAAFLDRLGDERLAARATRIAADLHALGAGEALHRALLDALGYSQNREPFARLAEIAPAVALRTTALAAGDVHDAEADLLAQLFDAAGLLDEPRLAVVRDDDGRAVAAGYRRRVDPAWLTGRLVPGAWELVGVRPANRPPRRLAALARLAARLGPEPLDEAVARALELPEPAAVVRALLELTRVPGVLGTPERPWPADFWAWHHDFGHRLPGAPLALIGEDRARAILTNALLPFALALADARGDQRLTAAAQTAWRVAPAGAPNWIVAEMRPLLGSTPIARARREQGMIELYKRCCAERRCATCPALSAAPRVTAPAVSS